MNKEQVINSMIYKLKSHANQEDIYMISGHNSFSYQDIIYAIENKTDIGLELLKSIENLNDDLIKRNKKPLWNE